MFKFFLMAAWLLGNSVHAAQAFTGIVSHVTDGDTIWVRPDAGGPPRKLRLEGIDSPEICQSGGTESRMALTQRALYQRVEVTIRQQDVYGRGLARVLMNGRDVAAEMVQSGQAWSYHWGRSLGPYAREESVARESRQGLFASGQAELPRDFRKRHGSCYDPK